MWVLPMSPNNYVAIITLVVGDLPASTMTPQTYHREQLDSALASHWTHCLTSIIPLYLSDLSTHHSIGGGHTYIYFMNGRSE